MEYKYRAYTPMMDLQPFFNEVGTIVEVLNKHQVTVIEMFFGWSWGEWEIFDTNINELYNEIKKQEDRTGKAFGENDVYIQINDYDMEILFCHEADIHIDFNKYNPIVSEILNVWKAKELIHCISKDRVNIAWSDLMVDDEAGFA